MSPLLALRLAAFVALGGALFALVLGLLSLPGAVPAPVGARRRLRARALSRSALLRAVDPVIRWLAARFDPVLPPNARLRLDRMLLGAGDSLGYVPAELLGAVLLAALAGAGLGAALGTITGRGGAYAASCALVAGLLPLLSLREATRARRTVVSRELPAAIDGLALAVSAGLDFPGALRQVIDAPQGTASPLVDELTTVLDQLALGQTRREALLGFAERVPVAGVIELVQAMVQAEEKGNPVIEVLLVQAQESRMKRSARAEDAASRAGVAMTLPLFLMFGCTMLVVLGPILLNVPRSLGDP
jgi:tight adherence protein C